VDGADNYWAGGFGRSFGCCSKQCYYAFHLCDILVCAKAPVIIIGLSAFYHDSAAAIIRDGEIIAAAQEERFSRIKNDSNFPRESAAYCLKKAGVSLDAVDFIGFYDKPLLTFNRLLETYIAFAPSGLKSFIKAIPVWVKEKIFQKNLILNELNSLNMGTADQNQIRFGYHHHSHAASAFFPSPFDEAAILIMDGVGEWATTSMGVGNSNGIELTEEIRFPHSLGLLYSAFTYYLGFKINEGEYRVMGLAPYGEPIYTQEIVENLIDVKGDGSFRLDMSYFNYCTGLTMTNEKFNRLFGGPPRKPSEPLNQKDMDIARSVQSVTEEIVLKLCNNLQKKTGIKNLCMAGGVALNCVANGRILREGPFENIWVQPAAGDAGASLGVAMAINQAEQGTVEKISGRGRKTEFDSMAGSYLGPEFDDDEILRLLSDRNADYEALSDDELFKIVANELDQGKVIGWFQGRMEFGPRALGNRSIIADARSTKMQRMLNLKIKYRESFRPFAPAVLREKVSDYFDMDRDSPYMLIVSNVKEEHHVKIDDEENDLKGLAKLNVARTTIPAITHVDYSARVQTVDGDTNPRFHQLLSEFENLTGCAVLVNTSFNVRDEPIVCTPEDAFNCFMGTEMDILVMGNFVLRKENQ